MLLERILQVQVENPIIVLVPIPVTGICISASILNIVAFVWITNWIWMGNSTTLETQKLLVLYLSSTTEPIRDLQYNSCCHRGFHPQLSHTVHATGAPNSPSWKRLLFGDDAQWMQRRSLFFCLIPAFVSKVDGSSSSLFAPLEEGTRGVG